MMYNFSSNKQTLGRTVFLLTLDKKKMTERIIIGEDVEVRLRLERDIGEVLFDETRQIGRFLLNFESDPDREWNLNAMGLHDNFAGLFPTKNVKSKAIKPYSDFLLRKYENGEPSAMFAAVRTWEDYWRCYKLNHGSDIFIDRTAKLYKPFFAFGNGNRLWDIGATRALSSALFAEESQVELWYPVKKRPFECVAAFSSLLPIIFYYLNRIEEWGLVFQQCKVCGSYFLTTSRHFELCGDNCRKVQLTEAKRQFDERNKGDKAEQHYEVVYQYWYNRKRKLKRNNAPEDEILTFSEAFKDFRKDAVKRKAEVKSGKMKLSEFTTWLAGQQDIVDKLVKHGRG